MLDKQQFITDILNSDSSLQKFIEFWSRQYKYAFYSVLELYAKDPHGTLYAETRQWNRYGRYILPGSSSIKLYYPDGSHKCVFDIRKTHGKEIEVWSLPASQREQALSLIGGGIVTNTDYERMITAASDRIMKSSFSPNVKPSTLMTELAAKVAAERLRIEAPMISASRFEDNPYEVFVYAHLTARDIIRGVELYVKGIDKPRAGIVVHEPVKIPDNEKPKNINRKEKAEKGSVNSVPLFAAEKKDKQVPEQLSFLSVPAPEDDTVNESVKVEQAQVEAVNEQSSGNTGINDYSIPDDFEPTAGQKGKYKDNVAAIRLLKQLEKDGRQATPEEQAVLARYNGWGGIPQAFDPQNNEWQSEYSELKSLLSKEEYEAARASTLNAHYTSTEVIDAIYAAVDRMGFDGGNILEPAMGVGNFFGRMPERFKETTVRYGVEIDRITGNIAKQLYPKAIIRIDGFENMKYSADSFDLGIGNVPFGDYVIYDRNLGNKPNKIHDYFFLKSVDLVRPGGLLAYITSTGTLDKKDSRVRELIAEKAELIGAIRLPQGTFHRSANTEVCTDILFLQKRAEPSRGIKPYWTQISETEDDVPVNAYYVRHPEMLLGKMEFASSMYNGRNEPTLVPFKDKDFSELLSAAVSNLPEKIYERQEKLLELKDSGTLPAYLEVENHAYMVLSNGIFKREGSIMVPYNIQTGRVAERIKGMVQIRDALKEVINAQLQDKDELAMQTTRVNLNAVYDEFVEKFGYLNSSGNVSAFSDDPDALRLQALEEPTEEKGRYKKSDIFYKPTIARIKPVTNTETASEALAVSLAEKGCVDLDFMQKLYSNDKSKIINELTGVIFKDPDLLNEDNGGWVTASEYLSGNIRKKYESANAAGMDKNAEALQKVMPEWIPAKDIDVKLGTYWIPPEYIKEFICEKLDVSWYNREKLNVNYVPETAQWIIEFPNKYSMRDDILNTERFGTKRALAIDIIETALNLRQVTVTDEVDEKRVVNKKETIAAREKQEVLQQHFKTWIFSDEKRKGVIEKIYNDRFNSIRLREYDGSALSFPGMAADISLRKHQRDAVARILYGGNTLLAHCVGAGKTYVMATACMELRRIGLVKKPMIVVPNHLCEQWAKEFLRLYPNAKILAATKKDFEGSKRRRLIARISSGDYDAVIIGHSSFGRIPVSKELSQNFISEQIAHIDDVLDSIDERENRRTVKQLEAEKKRLTERQKALLDESSKDSGVTFEELGVDQIFVDEAHKFKNLFLTTKMQNVAGISSSYSKRSSDLYMKCRYIEGLHESRRGVVFATGTPISNTMAEAYTMQRYLQFGRLRETGLDQFDAWASAFGEVVPTYEIAPDGSGYRVKNRFSRFHNMPELMTMFRECADIQTANMLNLPKPELLNGKYDIINVQRPPEYEQLLDEILMRSERIHSGAVNPHEDNYLKLTMDARDGALDIRLVKPDAPDYPDSKVNRCIDNVFSIYTETAEKKYVQVIFCDRSTPGKGFNIYDDIRNKLISRGVLPEKIAFVQECKSDNQKEELFAKARSGDVRVILASTELMGAGTNIQDRLYAEHHLDIPWRPSDVEQREGRILRQGNMCENVRIFRYVTEGSFDSYSYQTLETKQKFISQVMDYKVCGARTMEDVDGAALSYAEIKAIATGNPLILEKFKVDGRLHELETLKSQYETNHRRMENELNVEIPALIKGMEENLNNYSEDSMRVSDLTGDKFRITIGKKEYIDRKEAGEKLSEYLKTAKETKQEVEAGEISGFNLLLNYSDYSSCCKAIIKGSGRYEFELSDLPLGNIMRIENALSSIPDKIQKVKSGIISAEKRLDATAKELSLPFEHADEMSKLIRRKAELDSQLDLNKNGSDGMDIEPEPGKSINISF